MKKISRTYVFLKLRFDIIPKLKRPQYEVRCLRFRKCSLGQQGRGYRLSFRQFAEWNVTLYISLDIEMPRYFTYHFVSVNMYHQYWRRLKHKYSFVGFFRSVHIFCIRKRLSSMLFCSIKSVIIFFFSNEFFSNLFLKSTTCNKTVFANIFCIS